MTLAARMCRVLETSRNIHDGDLGGYLAAEALAHVRDALTPQVMFRAFNDIEDALAWEYMKEHARDEWSNLAPAEKEQWTRFVAAVSSLLDAAGT